MQLPSNEVQLQDTNIDGLRLTSQRTSQQPCWESDFIVIQKLWGLFLLLCTVTWVSHHVDVNQDGGGGGIYI